MADIVLRDGSGNYQTYLGAKALGVDTVDGGIAVFVSEDAVPSNYVHPATHPASMISGLVVGDIPQLATAERDFTLDKELGIYAYEVPGAWEHTLGDTYTVHWNGTDHTLQVKDFNDVVPGLSVHYLGNATKFWGLGQGEDTGEPFVVAFGDNFTCAIMTDTLGPHTVGITAPNTIKKLDEKYLPDEAATREFVREEIAKIEISGGGSSSGGSADAITWDDLTDKGGDKDLIAKQTVDWFTSAEMYGGLYAAPFQFPESGATDFLTDSFDLLLGETYIVEWDGTEYEVTSMDASAEQEGVLFLGNGTPLGLSGNGEPFAMGWADGAGVIFLSVTETISTHTIRLYQKGVARTIKREYIPDPPFFDLTAMGLPAMTPGTDVELEIDTTEIREAMAKGVVKFQAEMNSGSISLPVNIIGVPVEAMGTYACVTPVFFDEAIMTIHIEVTETLIIGRVRMLALTALS